MNEMLSDLWTVPGLIMDLLIVIILIISAVSGAKKGFVYCVIWFGAIVAAVMGARFAVELLEEPISTYFYEKAEANILETVKNHTPDLNDVPWDEIDFSGPREKEFTEEEYELLLNNKGMAELDRIMAKAGIGQESRRERFYSIALSVRNSRDDAAEGLSRFTAEQVKNAIHLLVRVVIIVVAFLLILILIRLLAKLISEILERIPLVGTTDQLLGLLLNLLVSAGFLLILFFLWQRLWPGSYESIENGTVLLKLIGEYNPLSGFFGN